MEFKTDAVLSVHSQIQLCEEGFGKVHEVFDCLVPGVFTHQLPKVADACTAWLEELHPQLKDFKKTEQEDFLAFRDRGIALFGPTMEVKQMPDGRWETKGPVGDAVEAIGKAEVWTK